MGNSRLSQSKDRVKKGNLAVRLIFTAIAVSVAITHLLWPDLVIDAVTLGLLVIALLPWAGSFIQSVEAGGVKAELRQQEVQIQKLEGQTESAYQKAEFAEQYSAALESTSAEASSSVSPLSGNANEAFAALASEYTAVRNRMKSGSERTAKMTAIVSRMVALAPNITDFDVVHALTSKEPGSRLSAYAYLYACPDFRQLEALVNSVTREDKPFNEYWSIRAIGRVLDSRLLDENIDMIITKLRKKLDKLGTRTDRYYELNRILRELERTSQDGALRKHA